jgi:hypothetical protein
MAPTVRHWLGVNPLRIRAQREPRTAPAVTDDIESRTYYYCKSVSIAREACFSFRALR